MTTDGIERYKITGVNGGLARCIGIIPDAKIYVTDSELETVGELIVVKQSGFDLLLGRPWSTVNQAGLCEAAEGTYMSFLSKGTEYVINVAPDWDYIKEHSDEEFSMVAREAPQKRWKTPTMVAAARKVSRTPVSDSEPRRNIPQEDKDEPQSQDDNVSEDSPPNQAGNQTQEWADNLFAHRGRAQSESEEDEEEQCWLKPPPGVHQFKETHQTDKGKDKSTVIQVDLQETYIRMVQKGADDAEWNQFCEAEKHYLNMDNDQWNEWTEKAEKEDLPRTEDPESENDPLIPPEPPEPSATLKSPEPTQSPLKKPQAAKPSKSGSAITAVRRSKRVRCESAWARESEEWKRMKQRAYERREKLTRKQVKGKGHAIPDAVLVSLGAKLSKLKNSAKKDQYTGERNSVDKTHLENDPKMVITPPDIEGAKPHRPLRSWDSKKAKPDKNQQTEDKISAEGTNRRGWTLIRERKVYDPLDDPAEITAIDETAEGWRVGPADGTYDPVRNYPWISRFEATKVFQWIRSLPGVGDEKFLVHMTKEDVITITIVDDP